MNAPASPPVVPSDTPASPPQTPWYVRPAIVLPLVSLLIVFTALLTPKEVTGRDGDPRLTTTNTEPLGASLFHDLARRLGWRVERRNGQAIDTAPDVIHAILDPVVPLRVSEAHALLEQVRGGGALLLVMHDARTPLSDSLHVRSGRRNGYVTDGVDMRAPSSCPEESRLDRLVALWPDQQAHLFALEWTSGRDTPVDTLLWVQESLTRSTNNPKLPAVLAIALGAGRVVIVSDPDFLRNDALRVCKFGLDAVAVRALEFLRDGGRVRRTRLVFDEYHQRRNFQPGTVATVTAFLSGTQSGHVLFQLLGAGLLLLVARAPRAIPPRERERIERRSPLEHVDALGRAYAQVKGTRTAASLLVRGLRRRLEHGTSRGQERHNDAQFLDRLEQVHPKLQGDIALLRRGLTSQLSMHDFALLGAAVRRIEHSLAQL